MRLERFTTLGVRSCYGAKNCYVVWSEGTSPWCAEFFALFAQLQILTILIGYWDMGIPESKSSSLWWSFYTKNQRCGFVIRETTYIHDVCSKHRKKKKQNRRLKLECDRWNLQDSNLFSRAWLRAHVLSLRLQLTCSFQLRTSCKENNVDANWATPLLYRGTKWFQNSCHYKTFVIPPSRMFRVMVKWSRGKVIRDGNRSMICKNKRKESQLEILNCASSQEVD